MKVEPGWGWGHSIVGSMGEPGANTGGLVGTGETGAHEAMGSCLHTAQVRLQLAPHDPTSWSVTSLYSALVSISASF